jgi:hypothetical protein
MHTCVSAERRLIYNDKCLVCSCARDFLPCVCMPFADTFARACVDIGTVCALSGECSLESSSYVSTGGRPSAVTTSYTCRCTGSLLLCSSHHIQDIPFMRPVGIRTISSTCHLSRHPHLVACCIGSLLEGHYARTAERWRRLAGRGSAPLALCLLCPLYPFCKICKDCFAGWHLLLVLRPSGRCVVRNVREKATLLQHHHVRPLVSLINAQALLGAGAWVASAQPLLQRQQSPRIILRACAAHAMPQCMKPHAHTSSFPAAMVLLVCVFRADCTASMLLYKQAVMCA